LSPSDLIAHFRTPFGQQGAGKLVTEFKWYYAAFMRGEDAALLNVGQTKSVQFFGAYQAEMSMLVEEISRREDDICVVLFSSDRSIHEIAPLRAINADIVFDVITGIRIPKEALRLDDNGEHVFLQTSGYAERVAVERIKDIEIGDNYLVRDGVETGTPLRAGSIIIVRANNLYHGKVVG
ncbi:MAG: hypothetical protein LBC71_05730, partial [Oscillospiraceae bacterium]|nr:hypothetical protein [Oscillospiraceae bacterium]